MKGISRWMLLGTLAGGGLLLSGCREDPPRGAQDELTRPNNSQDLSSFRGEGGSGPPPERFTGTHVDDRGASTPLPPPSGGPGAPGGLDSDVEVKGGAIGGAGPRVPVERGGSPGELTDAPGGR